MATELLYQKKKYWSKVLKETAIWTNTQRAIDTSSIFGEWAWSETMFFIWLNISNMFIFGLQPYELEPLDPEYRTELPTLEEFLQGIKIKFIPVDIGETYKEFYWETFKEEVPPLLDYVTAVITTCYPEFKDYLLPLEKRKLILGETKYGEGYLDPTVVRDFLRSTLYELAKRRLDFKRIKELYQTIVKRKMISEGVAETIYNRLVHHYQTLFQVFILDYNLLNYSRLSPSLLRVGVSYYGTSYVNTRVKEVSEKTIIPTITWKEELHTSEVSKFDEINTGLILNITPLNYGLLMDRKIMYKPTPMPKPEAKGTPMPSKLIDWKVRRMMSRYTATGVGFGNYNRPEEAFIFHKSERADQYHSLRLFYKHFDDLVENILANKDVDIYKKNMYKRAVAMLIGHKKKRHKWGYSAFKDMTEEEFKEFWLDYWSKQGLDINILNELYNSVIKWVKPLRRRLEDLGKRLAQRRKRLAQLL